MKVWKVLKTTYKVSDFIGWYKEGALNLNPDFQRRSVWKPGAKSYLIDTIIRGFPIPVLFLRDLKPDLKTFAPLRDVVDGQQRLRTVISYIAPHLMTDFDVQRDDFWIWEEHNSDLSGLRFKDLDADTKGLILDYQFTVNVLPSDADDREVKQVFSRMNATGYKLNAQELRNAEFYGAFKTLAESLATEQLDRWRNWKIFTSDNLARMYEVELTSELIILMLKGISEKSDAVISGVYEEHDKQFKPKREVAKRFRKVLDTIEDKFETDIAKLFRKRTIFYGLFAAVYQTLYGTGIDLKPKVPRLLTSNAVAAIKAAGRKIVDKSAPDAVMNATTRRTTHVRERKTLVAYLLKQA